MNGLSDHKWPFLQRLAHYRPDSFPVDIDVFPYTLAEIQAGQPIAQEALRNGRILWPHSDGALSTLIQEVQKR
jgi:hypothetical protein